MRTMMMYLSRNVTAAVAVFGGPSTLQVAACMHERIEYKRFLLPITVLVTLQRSERRPT